LIFSNVDHVRNKELRELSREASSLFLFASANFWAMLAFIEKADVRRASDGAAQAIDLLEKAASMFSDVAKRVDRDVEFRDRVQKVDLYAAGKSVLVDVEREFVDLRKLIAAGGIPDAFHQVAKGIETFASDLRRFREQLNSSQILGGEPDFEFVHQRLVSGWTTFIRAGQYISAVCLLAGEGPPHAIAVG
jgi:hypothetical protein